MNNEPPRSLLLEFVTGERLRAVVLFRGGFVRNDLDDQIDGCYCRQDAAADHQQETETSAPVKGADILGWPALRSSVSGWAGKRPIILRSALQGLRHC